MKSRSISRIALLAILFGSGLLFAFKKATIHNLFTNAYEPNFIPAKTNNELILLRANPKANIIRSLDNFDAAVSMENSPLFKLSDDELGDFRKTIVQRKGVGIVSLKYDKIQQILSYDDFCKVMTMFGLDARKGYWGLSNDRRIIGQMEADVAFNPNGSIRAPKLLKPFEDYVGYWCDLPHDCAKQKGAICMSGC